MNYFCWSAAILLMCLVICKHPAKPELGTRRMSDVIDAAGCIE